MKDICAHVVLELSENPRRCLEHRQAGAIITKLIGKIPPKNFSTLATFISDFATGYANYLAWN